VGGGEREGRLGRFGHGPEREAGSPLTKENDFLFLF
jgi:hypothetical protein